ncbi:MAG: DUF1848 domain-containing protein [Clostridiales bacterium]|nr:DUF1848 domain-containing protein [Clostridiales bacterium]
MIISASRRTDIPAFYSDWFFKRLEEGFLYVLNPYNRKQVSKIYLNTDTVDCFVFWTKNAGPMMDKLHLLAAKGFQYYFQFTITSYQRDIEPGIEDKNEVINTFKRLSDQLGKKRVIWRYDPIILNEKYTLEYHELWFEAMCKRLSGYTEKCVISFLDLYSKTIRNTKDLHLKQLTTDEMHQIANLLSTIAKKYNIQIESCCEDIDLSEYGINHGKCIDDRLVSQIIGSKLNVDKDDTQREICGCVKSIDIGQYSTCKHFCRYCYANYNYGHVNENCAYHDIDSPLLVDKLKGDEKITVREMKSIKCKECGGNN